MLLYIGFRVLQFDCDAPEYKFVFNQSILKY